MCYISLSIHLCCHLQRYCHRQQFYRYEEALRQQALDAGKEVKRWGESVTLPLMNPHDRRIIHMTLKDDAELTTESEGEGTMKKVVISLKKEANQA